MIRSLLKFLNFWYFRYLLVTELYMVEKWERMFINCMLVTLFFVVFYFNYALVLNATSSVVQYTGFYLMT